MIGKGPLAIRREEGDLGERGTMNDSCLVDSRSQQGELWKTLGCNWISCCEQLYAESSGFTVGIGVDFFMEFYFFE